MSIHIAETLQNQRGIETDNLHVGNDFGFEVWIYGFYVGYAVIGC